MTSLENVRSKREENIYNFMVKIKFRSKVATVLDEKYNDAYIGSGATHQFFHIKSSLFTYERIDPESVESA